ncbi:MAG: leucine-rich repeat protein [Bacteroidaceae bacterium]|nr:leucine-rich repeat protein [Bacteroidaceae bacterium]
MKRLILLLFTLLTCLGTWAKELQTFPVWIGNTQLSAEHIRVEESSYVVVGFDILKEGMMTYYPPTNKLTLHNASFSAIYDTYEYVIKFTDTGILELDGSNTITATNDCVTATANLTVQGSGSLQCTSNNCGFYMTEGACLTINACTVNAQGMWGISGNSTNERLLINNANVSAKGSNGSICDFNYSGYGNGVQLTDASYAAPEGATFKSSKAAVCDASGNVITETVVIRANYTDRTGAIYGIKMMNGGMKAVVVDYLHDFPINNLVIPPSISIDDKDYEVAAIGISAFSGCTLLNSVTIPETVTSIGSGAFYDCKNLTTVVVQNPKPVVIESNTFGLSSQAGNATYEKTLVVPIGSGQRYKNANYWKQFQTMQCYSIIDGCRYDEDGAGGAKIVACQSAATSFAIPASITVGGVPYPVTSIGKMAFSYMYCQNLESVTIPSSVQSIDAMAFLCSTLRAISIESGNTVYDSREGCNAIIETATNTLIRGTPSTIIPSTVSNIGKAAFALCGNALTRITIPASVVSIGDEAFMSCNLTTVSVKAKVPPTLGKNVFDNDVYTYATLKVLNSTVYQMMPGWKDFQHIEGAATTTSGDFIFAYDSNSLEAELVGYTGTAATVVIPKTISLGGNRYRVTSIGMMGLLNGPFVPNTTMRQVSIPTTVKIIGPYAFCMCKAITSINIPSSVNALYATSFNRCDALSSISVESGNTVYDSREGCNAIIETATNTLLKGLATSVIPSTVTSIGDMAFMGVNLTSISIPKNVKSIGMDAFQDCRNLGSVTLHNGLEYIGDNAFMGCSKLEAVTIPHSVKSIGDAFINSGLKEIDIPNNITSLSDYAFDRCDHLKSVTLSSTMTNIGTSAFRYCEELRTIKVKATTPPAMGDRVFGKFVNGEDEFGIYTGATLYVPKGCAKAYRSADIWKNFTHIEEFEDVLLGDINSDGMVDITDVVALVNYILNPSNGNFNMEASDFDNDRTISISDVVGLVNLILSNQ